MLVLWQQAVLKWGLCHAHVLSSTGRYRGCLTFAISHILPYSLAMRVFGTQVWSLCVSLKIINNLIKVGLIRMQATNQIMSLQTITKLEPRASPCRWAVKIRP